MSAPAVPPHPPTVADRVDAAVTAIHAAAQQHSDWRTLFPIIDAGVDACLSELLTSLDETQLAALGDRFKERRGRLPLSTGITDQIIGICQQILAFGAGGVALAVPFLDKVASLPIGLQKALAVAGLFYGQLTVLSLIVLILYILQARFRYPYLYFSKIGNTWPYFYYASISTDTPRSALSLPSLHRKGGLLYAEDMLRFAERSLTEQPQGRARVELQQYFLLVAYQGYVNQFSLRLANWFLYGLVGILASTIVLAVLAIAT
jgi:hypothetical protein